MVMDFALVLASAFLSTAEIYLDWAGGSRAKFALSSVILLLRSWNWLLKVGTGRQVAYVAHVSYTCYTVYSYEQKSLPLKH